MTDEQPDIHTTYDVKTHLNTYLKQVRDQGTDSTPVYFGAHRKREAVIISAAHYEHMQNQLEQQRVELLAHKHDTELTAAIASADRGALHTATRRPRPPLPQKHQDLIGGPAGSGRIIIERHEALKAAMQAWEEEHGAFTEQELQTADDLLTALDDMDHSQTPDMISEHPIDWETAQEDARTAAEKAAAAGRLTSPVTPSRHLSVVQAQAHLEELYKLKAAGHTGLGIGVAQRNLAFAIQREHDIMGEFPQRVSNQDFTVNPDALLARVEKLLNILEDIEIAEIVRERLKEPAQSMSITELAEQVGLDPKDFE